MSINVKINFLENIKEEFKRTISLNKCRSAITVQPKNNNLDCLIDLKFRNIIRFFVLLLKNDNDDPTINYFNKYYMQLVEMKEFNALNDSKPFFDQPVKKKQKAYGKIIEFLRSDNYTAGNLLDLLV